MRIYLAGPMSGIADHNYPAFHAEAARLRGLGFTVVSPAELNAGREHDGYGACMRRDLTALLDCDAIAMLERWELSAGASLERQVAKVVGLRVLLAAELAETNTRHGDRRAAAPRAHTLAPPDGAQETSP